MTSPFKELNGYAEVLLCIQKVVSLRSQFTSGQNVGTSWAKGQGDASPWAGEMAEGALFFAQNPLYPALPPSALRFGIK